jgi:hypothetical protein
MNNQQFIARQTVKYYWKALKHTTRLGPSGFRDATDVKEAPSWDYEQTPRVI